MQKLLDQKNYVTPFLLWSQLSFISDTFSVWMHWNNLIEFLFYFQNSKWYHTERQFFHFVSVIFIIKLKLTLQNSTTKISNTIYMYVYIYIHILFCAQSHTQKIITMWAYMLVNLTTVIISLCVHESSHHVVYLKYTVLLQFPINLCAAKPVISWI